MDPYRSRAQQGEPPAQRRWAVEWDLALPAAVLWIASLVTAANAVSRGAFDALEALAAMALVGLPILIVRRAK
jgi:hypothetical protein